MVKKSLSKYKTDHFLKLKTNDEIVAPLWFQYRHAPACSVYPTHGHAWGEFIYSYDGTIEIQIGEQLHVTPPRFGIWLPPNIEHRGINHNELKHGTLYIHESLCTQLNPQAGILLISPLVSALFEHLKMQAEQEQNIQSPMFDQEAHARLLHVILDQLVYSKHIGSYLPSSQHPALKQLIDFLDQNPSDQSALKDLAKRINMTERTLARLSQKELGMSVNEWRQRFKVMQAMTMLNQDKTVESIALDLGYANASAFINMFKRWMHTTPDQFRKVFDA